MLDRLYPMLDVTEAVVKTAAYMHRDHPDFHERLIAYLTKIQEIKGKIGNIVDVLSEPLGLILVFEKSTPEGIPWGAMEAVGRIKDRWGIDTFIRTVAFDPKTPGEPPYCEGVGNRRWRIMQVIEQAVPQGSLSDALIAVDPAINPIIPDQGLIVIAARSFIPEDDMAKIREQLQGMKGRGPDETNYRILIVASTGIQLKPLANGFISPWNIEAGLEAQQGLTADMIMGNPQLVRALPMVEEAQRLIWEAEQVLAANPLEKPHE